MEVQYSPDQLSAPNRLTVPLPVLLGMEPAVTFVPRPAEWDVLEAAWESVRAGHRRAVFMGGEAGTGKTRLVAEFARVVHRRSGTVLFGASTQDVEAPFQPFVQAFTHGLEALPDETRAALVGSNVAELDSLLPGLLGETQFRAARPEVDAETERYRLFEALISLLAGLARRGPVLLVLDDVHWARRPTLQLLDHVLRSTRLTQVCVLVTYRSAPATSVSRCSTRWPTYGAHRGSTTSTCRVSTGPACTPSSRRSRDTTLTKPPSRSFRT